MITRRHFIATLPALAAIPEEKEESVEQTGVVEKDWYGRPCCVFPPKITNNIDKTMDRLWKDSVGRKAKATIRKNGLDIRFI